VADEVKPPVAIRITRPYLTEDEFLEREFDTLTRTSVVLVGAQTRPQGVILRFEIVLKSGISVLRGEGRVVGYKPTGPSGEPGLTLRFTRLDAKSKALVDRAAMLREARIRGSSPPGTRPSVPPPAFGIATGSTGEVPAASPSFLAPSAMRSADRSEDLAAELTAVPAAPASAPQAPPAPAVRPSSRPPPLPPAYRARAMPPQMPPPAFVSAPAPGSSTAVDLESTQVERFSPDEPVARPRSVPPTPLRVPPEPESAPAAEEPEEPIPAILEPMRLEAISVDMSEMEDAPVEAVRAPPPPVPEPAFVPQVRAKPAKAEPEAPRAVNGATVARPAQRDALLDRLRDRARALPPARVSAILAKRP
jgi:hypothetical protein